MLTYDIVNAPLLQANAIATVTVLQAVEECVERFDLTLSQKTTALLFSRLRPLSLEIRM